MDLQSEPARQRWVPVVEGVPATFQGEVRNDRLYVLTNEGASRYRVLVADPGRPQRSAWREIVPEGEATIDGIIVLKDRIIVSDLFRACSRLRTFDLEGRALGSIPLPDMGTVHTTDGPRDGSELVFDFETFFSPAELHHYDARSGKVARFEGVERGVDPARFAARQVEYRSRDGAGITMFLLLARDAEPARDRATILNGYGGFNISITPTYSGSRMVWLERGGIIAIPNLRGGGEYGEEWHNAGMLERKQNVFDDFIAAAEWLIREGYSSPDRLAVSGGSNGGLLVGAAITQRPELFRAAVCSVPLLDMVRYHRFLIARLWIPEYGSSEDPDQFKFLYDYSPYHRVTDGVGYPAVLLATADTDTRVAPLHARKMAARLQAATASGRPVLLRVETKAGHGAGKPISKAIEESADAWAFLEWQLGTAAE